MAHQIWFWSNRAPGGRVGRCRWQHHEASDTRLARSCRIILAARILGGIATRKPLYC